MTWLGRIVVAGVLVMLAYMTICTLIVTAFWLAVL